MAQASKTFRIFVSSTFSDLKEERNALQQCVFPKLRQLCMQYGYRFQAIDLRWGVSEEAALDQQTMNICLQELERCKSITPRPNFIVLLGDRYGWRPLPPQVEAEEFEAILDKVTPEDKEPLLWKEQQSNDRKGWYRKDENATPAEYCLRPREVNIPDNASDGEKKAALDREAEEWEGIEKKLRSTLLQAIERLGWPDDDPRRIKYETSATHQEILHGALDVPDAHEHVYCFFREIKDLPHEPKARDFVDLDESGHLDEEAHNQLESLKKNLRDHLPGNYFEYKTKWAGDGATTEHIGDLPENIKDILKQDDAGKGFGKLCLDVYACLSRVILKQIEQLEELDALDTEITAQDNFGKERARFFTGRAGILQSIHDYLKGIDTHPLAIFGESGSGKTAVMARAVQRAREANPDAEVISRLIGATPSSSDGRSLLDSLCHQISRCYRADESTIPTEYQKLVQEFPERLALATKEKPLILFLDALDQLSDIDNARSLAWLPPNLPENVRLVVSCLPGECLSALKSKLPAENLVELEPMPLSEGKELLSLWLKDAGRKLQSHQRDEVLGKFEQCGLPLYLKLAFEEARRWKSYTEKELSLDIPGVIRDLFGRLSLDANHGMMMVSRSLGYLTAAKNGLTEDELLDVLSQDEEVLQDFIQRAYHEPPEERLPVVVWSRLYFDLEPYLTERTADGTSLMTFYHPTTFGQAVITEYLAGDTKRQRHRALAQYFGGQKLYIEKEVNLRKVSEMPYQQTYGELWDEIEQTLCDLRFIEAKCAAGMTYDLIADYNAALNALPEAQEERQKELEHEKRVKKYTEDLIAYAKGEIEHLDIIPSVEPWSEERIREDTERIINNPARLDRMRAFFQFVNSESHALLKFASHPGFVLQQAYNSASSGPVASAAEEIINAGVDTVLLLHHTKQRPNYNPHPALLKTLEGHEKEKYVASVAITPDGKKAVSGSNDKTLKVWDLDSGECLGTLKGHKKTITGVEVTPDGRKAISGSFDDTIRLWDLDNAACLSILRGHAGGVNSVAMTPDGRMTVAANDNETLKVWNVDGRECLWTLLGHTDIVHSVVMTPDGRKALSGSDDKTLRLWDLETGECLRILQGHMGGVNSIVMTPDGRKALSGSDDKTLRLWDLETGECLRILQGHTGCVDSIVMTPDGKRAVSGDGDTTLHVWDLDSGKCLRTLWGHTHWIESIDITPDGRRAASGSWDGTLRLWDLESGECLRTLEGHTGQVSDVAITPDRKKVISGSYDETLRLWDLEKGQCMITLKGHTHWITSLDMTFDGKRAISGSDDETLKVWDLDSGTCLKTLEGHINAVTDVKVTPDGRRIVSGSADKTLQLWDVESGNNLETLIGHRSRIMNIAITPEGRKAISVSQDHTPMVWDLDNGVCLKTLRGHMGGVNSVAVTPDGTIAVSGSDDKALRLWNLETGECLKTLEGHTDWVYNVSITPDGKRAVSGSRDNILCIWDLESSKCRRTLEGHTDWVYSLSITPDGKRVVTGSADKTLRLWDMETGECIGIYQAASPVTSRLKIRVSDNLACGTETGRVIFLTPRNIPMGTSVITPVRIWLYGERGSKGRWDDDITAVCQWCGARFPVADEILNVITAIARDAKLSPDQSPCLELPAEAWDESHLLSECPHCHKPLKFNPFIVDNKERC